MILNLDHGLFVKRNDHHYVQETVSNLEKWSSMYKRNNALVLACVVWILSFIICRSIGLPGYSASIPTSFIILVLVSAEKLSDQNQRSSGWCDECMQGIGRRVTKYLLKRYLCRFVGLCLCMFIVSAAATAKTVDRSAPTALREKNQRESHAHVIRADVYNLFVIFFITVVSVWNLLHWGWLRRLLKSCKVRE